MKFKRESTEFLFPGQRRMFLWVQILLLVEDLVRLCSFGVYWVDLSSPARERYWQRYTRIDYLD